MSNGIERAVVEEMAKALVGVWVQNMTLSGARAFRENEAKREAIIADAERLGIREAVYSRATDIMHGGS